MRPILVLMLAVLLLSGGAAFAQITCPDGVPLAGTSADDVPVGTSGNDRIVGNGGRDTIHGGAGSDCLFGGSFNDKLFGEDGNDELIGEGGDDLLDGGPGDDLLNGGDGNDTLIGGTGTDSIFGGGGNDVIVIHAGDVPAGATETIDGGSGIDTAAFDFDPGSVTFPNFTVTDPKTGGKYRFFSVEKVARLPINGCGNGVKDPGEECDDGNLISGDGCDANCTLTRCGNGIVTAGEQCDDGNNVSGDGCSATCKLECGDGLVQPGEQCDDGNTISGDGCDANCTFTRCGNGIVTAGEECDDGNNVSGDGCSATCRIECGDGVIEGSEQCDDGNRVSGDGCSATCQRECTSSAQCPASDPCTPTACTGGVCTSTPPDPFPGAICKTGALAHLAECSNDALPAKLALPGKVKKIQVILHRASMVSKRGNLILQSRRVLAYVGTRTARLASKGKISAACASALEQHIAELDVLVSSLR